MLKQNKLSESKSVRGKAKPIQIQDPKISTTQENSRQRTWHTLRQPPIAQSVATKL